MYEKFALLGYYTASSGNFLPTFRGQLIGPILRVQESKRLSRNIGNKLHYSLCNNPEERSSQLLRGRSLKSCQIHISFISLTLQQYSAALPYSFISLTLQQYSAALPYSFISLTLQQYSAALPYSFISLTLQQYSAALPYSFISLTLQQYSAALPYSFIGLTLQ